MELARLGAGQALCKYESSMASTLRRCVESKWDPEVLRALELAAGFCMVTTQRKLSSKGRNDKTQLGMQKLPVV